MDWAEGTGGTATSGTDYTAITGGTLTFAAGTTSQTIDVSVTGDTDDEPYETVVVTLSNAANATISTATGTGTIANDDGHLLSIDSPSVTEGNSGSKNLTFTVTLNTASAERVTVDWADAGTGTAASGTDYTAIAGGTLTFAAGTTSQTIDVSVTGDAADEADETILVTLSNALGATISTATGTGTIADNDPEPSLSINSPSVTEGDSGSKNLTFTVKLSAASGKRVTVDYVDAGTGTATPGTDYTAIAGGTLTFEPGDTEETFDVSVTGDGDGETNEIILVTLRNATNATIGTARGTGTITDDDAAHAVSIDSPTVEERDSGSRMLTFTINLTRAHEQWVSVYLRDAGTGTATPGTDYTAFVPQWVNIAPGDTENTVSISVTGDRVKEPDETVALELVTVWQNRATISTRFGTGTIVDDDTTPGLSISSPRVTEGNSGSATLTYAVTLTAAISEQVTVDYADAGTGTATSGTDYTAITGGTLTFAANETSKTIAVSVTGDATVEPHETVAVRLSNASGATILTATGTGTIANDDGASSISISSPTVVEGTGGPASLLRFTVTLSSARSQSATIYWWDAGTGTASPGSDYAEVRSSQTLEFEPGEVSKTFDLPVITDSGDEPDETVVIAASESTSGLPRVSGTGTITDDDPTPTLSIDSPSVNEGDSSTRMLEWTVSLSAESGREVTVAYASGTGGTATAGTDHTALVAGTLTFTQGDTIKTFGVSVTGDTDEEPNETVVATLSGATNATISTATGTGTIVNDDGVLISIDSPSVTEGDSGSETLTFTATLSTASAGQVTVDYADAGTGTATSGTDYTAIAGGTLTFAAGTTSQTFDVSVTGDAVDEGDETILVTLSNASGATISAATGTGTITDNDGAPTLSIDSPSVTEGDNGSTTLTYTATLNPASGQRVTVNYADTETGTALAGVDYTTVASGSLTFAAGTTSQTFDVSVIGDVLSEADETILVSLSGPANAVVSSTAGTGTGTITDDDPLPALSIDSPSVNEGNSGSATLTYTVTMSPASGRAVTVSYADAGTGTATSGTDYTAITGGTLIFAAGTTSQTFDVSVTGDTDNESYETIVVTLSNASGATIATGTGTGTIANDDGHLLSIDSPSVEEGDSGSKNLTYTVTLSPAKSQQVTVAYADAGTGTATSGTDYAAIAGGTLTFAANETSKTITVSVTGDGSDEESETILVTLSNPVGATISTATGTGTITDNDVPPSLTIGSASVAEGNSGSATLTFKVTLSPASGKQVTVNYADAGTGTATSGTDYTAITGGTLTFAAGTTSQTFDVSVTGDTDEEPNETIVVSLSSSTNATVSSTGGTGTGTIINDDGTPSFSISSPSVIEGNSGSATLTYTVTLLPASAEQLSVRFSDAGTGTATAGTDYAPFRLRWLDFAAGETRKTVSVAVTGDAVKEPNETVVAELYLASGATGATIGTRYGTGTITDDDTTPGLSISSPQVTEGNSGSATLTYKVTLTAAASRQVTVSYADAGTGTATSGTDYTAITGGTLTFAVGDTEKTFGVSVTGDTDVEPHETVVARLSAASGATILTATGTGTIVNDDGASTLSVSSPTVTEPTAGGEVPLLRFAVTLGAARSQTAQVYWWDTGTGTATAGSDYGETGVTAPGQRSLTFGAGEVSKTVDISVRDDYGDEPDETVVIAASEAANGQPRVTGTGTIKDNDDTPTFSIDSPTVTEGDAGSATLTYTVRMSGVSGREVTVDYADAGTGTATSGTDYVAIAGATFTFPPWTLDASATFDVSVTGDTVDEPDETILVALSNPTNATVSTTAGTGTGTIADDDPPAISIDSPTVTEGSTGSTVTLKFKVSLSSASEEQVLVNLADVQSGTATKGTDYNAWGPLSVVFAPGETAWTIDVTVNGDELDEADETILARLSNPTNATIATADGTGTITDDDPSPTLSIDTPTVNEGDTGSATMTYTVTLDPASGQQVTVDYEDAGTGTATSGTDYGAISKGTLTFVAGETSKTFVVSVTGDTLDEVHETVLVTLSNPANATVSSTAGTGTGTITDDDGVPTLSIDSPTVTEGDDGSATLTYKVTLSAESGKQVTVAYADAGTGTATSGTDYTAITGATLTFVAGTTSQTFDVSITGDAMDEPNETILVTLSGPTNAVVSTTAGTGTGTITDDDDPPGVRLALADASISENAGTTTVSATLGHASSAATTVTVTAVADAYTVGSDATITIAAGETANATDSVTITAVDDDVDNVTARTATVSASASNIQGIGSVAGVTLTLTDDEPTPTVALALSEPDATAPDTIDESGTDNATTVTATLSGKSSAAVTLTVAATGATAAAGDFTLSSARTLTIAAGATSSTGTVTVAAVDDTTDEADETVTVSATVSGTSGVANPTSRTLTITDDDDPPEVRLALAAASIAENGGTTTVSATLGHASSAATTVTVTAVADAYTVGSDATITIAAGETANATDTATINAEDDAVDNVGNRAVTVTGTAQNSQGVGTVTGAALTLTDDEATPTATLVLSPATIAEHDGTNVGSSTVTATLNRASSEAVTLTVAATAGTNAAAGDFSLSSAKTLTIAAGATSSTGTVTVTAVDNTTDAPDKGVTVSAAVSGDSGVAAPASVTLTIEDDEAAPTVTLEVAASSIAENGGTTTVTAKLGHASSAATTITVTAVANAYTVGSDATITIAAGETANATDSVTITAEDDAVDNVGNRAVTVTGTARNSQGVGTVTGAPLTLTDDEATPAATLVLSPATIDEHDGTNVGSSTVTATLNRASSEAVTLTVAATAGTNAAAGDFSLSSAKTLTIAAGATSSTGTVTVTAVDNTTDAPDKEVTVAATVSGDSGVAAPASVTLTIEDDEAAPGVTLEVAASSISESGGSTTVSATLGHASSAATTITVTAVAGAYTVGSDATITIAAGETANAADTATINAVNNDKDEPDRSVTVTGSAQNSQGAGAVTGASLTITDDDAKPTVTLEVAAASIAEDGGSTTVSATLGHPSSAATTITVTAVTGAYTVGSDATITIAAGETANATDSVTINAVNDAVDNVGNRAVTVTGTARNSQGVGPVTGAALTLTDDEATPAATLVLSPATIDEHDGTNVGSSTVTATLNRASSEAVTLTVAATAGTNAAAGDFSLSSAKTLTIAAGATTSTGTVTVTAVNNTTDAPDKEVTVTAAVSGNSGVAAPASVTLTIEDDEAAPEVRLEVAASSISESGGTTTVSAKLGHASSAATTITVTAVADAYTVGSDATITIAAGETANATDSVTITAVDDAIDNVVNRTVTVTGTAQNSQGVGPVMGASLTLTDDEGAPTATLVLSPATIAEHDGTNAGSSTVTATLNRASSKDVTLTVGATAGTNAAASDFSLSSAQTLTIAAGATSSTGTVTVTAVDDTTDAPDKEVTVSAAVSGDSGVAAPASVTLTIEDDEAAPTVTLALAASSITESGGTTTVTATLGHASSAATTITVTAVANAYTVGSDATITIAAGETANATDSVTIAAVDDAVDNVGNRAVRVAGTARNSQGVGPVTGAALTLTDDEATPAATLVLSPATIDEHDGTNVGSSTVTATLNRASSEAVTLTVGATAGTNAAASDFSLSSAQTLTIAAGATTSTGTVTVTAVNNTTDAPDKEVTVSAAVSGNSGVAAPASVTLTIEDDEAAPTVRLEVAASSIAENGGTTTVSATLSHASSAATRITVTAVANAYTVGSDATITIAAGETANATDSVTIAAVDDAVDNVGNRAVRVAGTAQNSQGVGMVTGAALTLTDDEATPAATLVLSPATIAEHDGTNVGSSTVTATLNGASSEAVTLTVGATAGTNAAAGDFSLSSAKTLTIAAGATSSTGTVTVTAVNNTTDAPDKEVTVSATVSGDSGVAAPASVTLTIEDDEAAPTVTLEVADSSISENGGTTTVSATLGHASSAATTITVTAVTGAYTVGSDATITIAAGETANAADTATIDAVNNDKDEPDRSVTVTGSAQNSQGAGAVSGAALTITDDDAKPTVTLEVAASSISENGGTTTVSATLSHASSAATTVTVTAVAGAYTVSSDAMITIAAGETANATDSVTITAVNDAVDNVGNRSVTVIGTAQNSQGVGTVTGAALTLTDDEATPAATLVLSPATIDEHDGTNVGSSTVTATLNRASSEAVTLTVAATAGTNAVASDFSLSSEQTLSIAAGATSSTGTVTVTAVNNTTDAPDKEVTVSAAVSGDSGVAAPASVTLTIEDDEAAPTVTLEVAASSIAENGGTTTVSATLGHASSAATTITVTAVTGAYTVGSDATITIAAGETANAADTARINAVNNDKDEPDRSVTVTGSAQNSQGAGAVTGAALTITDDDAKPTVTLAVADSSIAENGGTTTVSATLSHASSAATTVTVAAVANAYTVGSDATITIAAGETANATDTVMITAVDDAIDNVVDRTVTVTGTAQNSQGVGTVMGASLTLTDDEGAPAATLVLSPAAIAEHDGSDPGSSTVTATLNGASSEVVTLTVAATAGTNAAASDFSLSTEDTLTIAAGATTSTGTVTVTAVDNAVDAPDKEVTVSATVSGDSGVAAPASVTLTIEDDEAAPGVTLAVADAAIAENGGTTTVTATLDHASSAATTITVTAEDGAYTVGDEATITIAAGETANTAGSVTITAVDDAIDNVGDRTVTVSGTAQNSQGAGTVTGASLTLTDDEGAPAATLVLSPAKIAEHDGTNAGSSTVTATLNGASSEVVTLTVAATAGTNAAASDFSLSSEDTLTIAAGATTSTGTVTVTAVNDAVDAPDKEVTVSATVSGDSGVADPASVTLTIEDDEAAPGVTLAVADSAIAENGGTTAVSATLSHASSAATTITVTAVDRAYAVGSDATIAIAAGETANATDSVTITALDNDVLSGDRAVTVTGTAQNSQGVGAVTGAALTLRDDEDGTSFAMSGWVEDQSWTTGQAITPFTLPAAIGGSGEVSYELSPELPAGVSRNADTREVSGTPSAAKEETGHTWTATDSGGATVHVTFTIEVREGQTDSPPAPAPPPPPPEVVPVTVSIGDASIMEGDRTMVEAEFTVKLDQASPEPVTVAFATRDATAIAGADYEHRAGSVTFAPGETRQMIAVPVLPDTTVEATEEFMVALVEQENVVLERALARGTIGDNDVALLAIDDTQLPEGDSGKQSAWFEVRMISKTERPVWLRYTTMDGTARAGEDYEAANEVLIFAPGEAAKRFAVAVLGDTLPEDDETFGVTLYDAEQRDASQGLAAEGMIKDDDQGRWQRGLKRALAEFARVVATDAVATIGERFAAGEAAESQVTLHGRRLALAGSAAEAEPAGAPAEWTAFEAESEAMSQVEFREFLAASSFDVVGGAPQDAAADVTADGGVDWSVWSRGSLGRYSGQDEKPSAAWDGGVYSGYLGADIRMAPLVLGLAVSHSAGTTRYQEPVDGTEFKLEVDTWLTSVLPYAHWELESLDLWTIAGAGVGGSALKREQQQQRLDTRNVLWLGAAGGRLTVVSWNGLDVALATDGYYASLGAESEETPWLTNGLDAAEVGRVRLLADTRYDWQIGSAARLGVNLEAGGRWDTGDAAQGFGAEIGGGVDFEITSLGLGLRAHGRYLLAHQDWEFQDWGASAALSFDPGAPGRGVAVTVAPVWGSSSSQVANVWGAAPLQANAGGGEREGAGLRPDRLDAELSYGIETPGGGGLVTVYGGLSQGLPDSTTYRMGSRMELGALSLGLSLDRQEHPDASPAHGVELEGRLNW